MSPSYWAMDFAVLMGPTPLPSPPLRATGSLKSCKTPVERFRSECGQEMPAAVELELETCSCRPVRPEWRVRLQRQMLQLEEAVTPLQAQAEQTLAQAEALQR